MYYKTTQILRRFTYLYKERIIPVRKFFSILLCITLSLSMFLVPVSAQEQNSEIDDKVFTVFKYLGIAEVNENTDFSVQVSRAEFADYVAKLMHLGWNGTKTYFADVQKSYWAYDSINALYEMNYISSSADSMFRPDDKITYAEACKILLTAAGYGNYAVATGGFPNGYVNTISMLKLKPRAGVENDFCKGAALELIYNVFSIGIYQIEKISGGSITSSVSDENTLFSIYCGVKENEGVVSAVFGKTMDKNYTVEENTAIVGSEKYDLEYGVILDDFFCADAEIVYEYYGDGAAKAGKIIYAEPKKTQEDIIVIDSKMIDSFDASLHKLKYYKNEQRSKSGTVSIGTDALVIYNGYPTLRSPENIVSEFVDGKRRGTIKIKKGSNSYDIVAVDSYVSFILGSKDTETERIFDKLNQSKISLKDYRCVKIVDSENRFVKFADIAVNSVLSIAESDDNAMITVRVSDKTVTGTVTGKNDDDDEYSLALDNKNTYEIEPVYYRLYGKDLSIGNSYTFYLDCFGRIAYDDTKKSKDKNVGYIISAKPDRDNENIILKMFTDQGKVCKYEFSDKLKIDGISYKGSNRFMEAIDSIPGTTGILDLHSPWNEVNNPKIVPQVVIYELDDEGKIRYLDTTNISSYEDPKNTLTQIKSSYSKKLCQHIKDSNIYRFDLNIIYSKQNTLTMMVPYTNADGYLVSDTDRNRLSVPKVIGGGIYLQDSDYKINKFTPFSGRSYMVEGYRYSDSNDYCDILLVTNPLYTDYENPIIVSKILTTVNDDNEIVQQVKGIVNGNYIDFEVEDKASLSGVAKGDIIKGVYNTHTGKLSNVLKIYDVESGTFMNKGTNPNTPEWWYDGYDTSNYMLFNTIMQLSVGYVTEKTGNEVRWSYTTPTRDQYGRLKWDECYYMEGVPCVVYDKETGEVYDGSVEDIVDCKSGGTECSKIIRMSFYEGTRSVYIIK